MWLHKPSLCRLPPRRLVPSLSSETWRYLPFKDTRKSSEYTRAFDMEELLLWMPLTLGRKCFEHFEVCNKGGLYELEEMRCFAYWLLLIFSSNQVNRSWMHQMLYSIWLHKSARMSWPEIILTVYNCVKGRHLFQRTAGLDLLLRCCWDILFIIVLSNSRPKLACRSEARKSTLTSVKQSEYNFSSFMYSFESLWDGKGLILSIKCEKTLHFVVSLSTSSQTSTVLS